MRESKGVEKFFIDDVPTIKAQWETCTSCFGQGEHRYYRRGIGGLLKTVYRCFTCNGIGKVLK